MILSEQLEAVIYVVRGRPFNFWGGGGFEKKFPARLF